MAGAPPMKTAVEAFKLSNGLFCNTPFDGVHPLLFVDELEWFDVAGAAAGGFVIIVMLAVFLERFAFCHEPIGAGLVPVCIVLIIFPASYTKLLGAALAFGLMLLNWKRAT